MQKRSYAAWVRKREVGGLASVNGLRASVKSLLTSLRVHAPQHTAQRSKRLEYKVRRRSTERLVSIATA